MDSAGVSNSTTIIVAAFGALAVVLSPIVPAWINRGGKAQPAPVSAPPPDLDLIADLDQRLDRVTRENERLVRSRETDSHEMDRLVRENERLRAQLVAERLQHAREIAENRRSTP